jgi:hypothetical protein
MLLKQIGLAALAATFITGSAAVANAQRAGSGGPTGDNTSEAALQDHKTPFSGRGWHSAPKRGSHAYGSARGHSSKKPMRNTKTTSKSQ